MVKQLLAAGAAVDAKDKVRGGAGEGWVAEHSSACLLGFRVSCFSNYGFRLQN